MGGCVGAVSFFLGEMDEDSRRQVFAKWAEASACATINEDGLLGSSGISYQDTFGVTEAHSAFLLALPWILHGQPGITFQVSA